MKCLIIDNNSNTLDKLIYLLESFRVECSVASFGNIHEVPLDEFDVFILSGGNALSNPKDDTVYFEELNLIQNTNKPILGIGLGFQLICINFGAEVVLRGERITGIINLQKVSNDKLFEKLKEDFIVSESHKYVVKSVSDPLEILADSLYGVEIVRHKKKLIYGFQFRPEILPDKTLGDELLKNFLNLVEISKNKFLHTRF